LAKDLAVSQGISDNYSLGARVTWNLFDGGAANSQATQQQINQSIAETNFITSRDQVRLQVEQSYLTLKANQLNIGTAKIAQDQAVESLRLARLRLAAGVGTQADVISAETDLTTARSNYSTAIVNYNRALSTLRNAVYVNQF
jgi:OMF family outer membrane factor